jgi:hypothetical protein
MAKTTSCISLFETVNLLCPGGAKADHGATSWRASVGMFTYLPVIGLKRKASTRR